MNRRRIPRSRRRCLGYMETLASLPQWRGPMYSLVIAISLASVSCRTTARHPTADKAEPRDMPATVALPQPGDTIPLNPQTLGTINPSPPSSEVEGRSPEPLRTFYGDVEELGPFSAQEAADGQWIRITSVSGIPYVLVPGRLWVLSRHLHINTGVSIRVRGYLRQARGRIYIHAVAIDLWD